MRHDQRNWPPTQTADAKQGIDVMMLEVTHLTPSRIIFRHRQRPQHHAGSPWRST